MDTIRLWISGLTVSAVVGAVVLVLAPEGSVGKSVKTMVSVFIISSILLPLMKNKELQTDFDFAVGTTAIDDEKILDTVSASFEKKLARSVEDILLQNGIHTHQVSIDIKTNKDEISVEKVSVELEKESSDKTEEAKTLLNDRLQISAEVYVKNTED
ncbi:MAG: hypothetical protein IJZ88_08550 [Clostridia bacterium]|nr:hypothetical protein [Clostridia bacterium]